MPERPAVTGHRRLFATGIEHLGIDPAQHGQDKHEQPCQELQRHGPDATRDPSHDQRRAHDGKHDCQDLMCSLHTYAPSRDEAITTR